LIGLGFVDGERPRAERAATMARSLRLGGGSSPMGLTKRQQALFTEAEAIAKLTSLDFHRVKDTRIGDPDLALQIAIHKMVISEVVLRYTLLDEILADLIAKYFFDSSDFPKLWRTKKFSTFVHHVLDEMYLLKKMDVVHAIKPLPSDVMKAIRKVNAVRNAFAHSLFPENRKEHRKNKKVLYGDKDIRTNEGSKNFLADYRVAFTYLERRFERKIRRRPTP
jgi:hypothetical protein